MFDKNGFFRNQILNKRNKYGEDTREEVDIHAGSVKWKKKGQSI